MTNTMVEKCDKCKDKCCEDDCCCESALEDLKEVYSELQKKHNFPSFKIMNEEFNIERMAEVEFDIPLREIRRFVSDKIRNYERFVEAILNPSNANMFIFTIIKAISPEDKEKLSEVYKKLIRREIDLVELDIQYNEEKEVKFINNFYSEWQKIKPIILNIFGKINANWDKEIEKTSKSYFG